LNQEVEVTVPITGIGTAIVIKAGMEQLDSFNPLRLEAQRQSEGAGLNAGSQGGKGDGDRFILAWMGIESLHPPQPTRERSGDAGDQIGAGEGNLVAASIADEPQPEPGCG
jgi:hypothetical protein